MHWLDSTILALLAAAAVFGAWSGLVNQLFRWAGFGLSLYAAVCLHAWAGERLSVWFLRGADPLVCDILGYAVVFLVVYSVVFLAALLVERGVRAARLQGLNRSLGALLALGKMGLLLGAIAYALQKLPVEAAREPLEESAIAPLLARGVELGLRLVPEEQKQEWTSGLDKAAGDLAPVRR